MRRSLLRFTLLAHTLSRIGGASTETSEYWTLKDPRINLPVPFKDYRYPNTVIYLSQSVFSEETSLYFEISHTENTIFDQMLILRARCSIPATKKVLKLGYFGYSYHCDYVYFQQFKSGSLLDDGASPDGFTLQLQSGGGISLDQSLNDLREGFYFSSDEDELFEFYYETRPNQFINVTDEYEEAIKNEFFPYISLFIALAAQIAALCVFAWAHDKRRIPLFTMFAVCLGNFPMLGIMKKIELLGKFTEFSIFYVFQGIVVFALFFLCLGRSSRRKEKTYWFGVLMLTTLGIAFPVTTIAYGSYSVDLTAAVPFLLAVEKITYSKHRWLGLVGWVMTAAQGLAYSVSLLSKRLMRASLLNFGVENTNFPYRIYWGVSVISLICCLFGPHIRMGHDWKIAGRALQVTTVEGRTGPSTQPPRTEGLYQGVEIKDDYANLQNNQAPNQTQGRGGVGLGLRRETILLTIHSKGHRVGPGPLK